MIKTVSLSPGITLRCFPDTRFKQGCLSVQFVRPMCREEAAMNALLPAVLLRGCESCPDLRAITLRLDDLYGASVGAVVRRVGDYHTTGLHCSFIEDRYALQGDTIFRPMVAFLQELLLHPLTENGCFPTEFVQSEKKNLISTIDSVRNDKRAYASNQLLRDMCSRDSFGIPRLGEREDVEAITPEGLYAHYRKLLSESHVELFYVGSADPEQVEQLLKPLFAEVERSYVSLPAQTAFQCADATDRVDTMDVTQGRLCMGFVSPITLRTGEFAAMQVLNTIFGSSMTSKLFMHIREKLSLCYDIGSGYHGSKGLMLVSAGIDFDQDTLVRQEILHQLDLCRQGQITDTELTAAKQALISQLQATHDAPGSIEGYYSTAALSGLAMTPAEYMQAVEAVTVQDAAKAAASLHLHSVYFLRGER